MLTQTARSGSKGPLCGRLKVGRGLCVQRAPGIRPAQGKEGRNPGRPGRWSGLVTRTLPYPVPRAGSEARSAKTPRRALSEGTPAAMQSSVVADIHVLGGMLPLKRADFNGDDGGHCMAKRAQLPNGHRNVLLSGSPASASCMTSALSTVLLCFH